MKSEFDLARTGSVLICSMFEFGLLMGCRSEDQVKDHVVRRELAGEHFSAAICNWRDTAASCAFDPDRKPRFCESADPPAVSWRFVGIKITDPEVDQPNPDLDAPWNSKVNEWYRNESKARGVFSMSRSLPVSEWSPYTKIMALRGDGTAFDTFCGGAKLEDLPEDVIVVCEVKDSGVEWMQPGDLELSTLPREINPRGKLGISGNYPGGVFIGFADGNVWYIRDSVPFEELAKLFTVDSAREFDREAVLGNYVIEKVERWEDLHGGRN